MLNLHALILLTEFLLHLFYAIFEELFDGGEEVAIW